MSAFNLAPSETNIRTIVQAIIQILQGRSNAVGTVTLAASVTTTVVNKSTSVAAVNVSLNSQIFLTPLTAHAAAALTNVYVSAVGQGTFTLTHSSAITTDRSFGWEARG